MKLSVLAIDYDGTSATGDAMDPAVKCAIACARERGITVVLVTGRRLEDLRSAAGDLHFLDAVVAENGAVLNFPASGHVTTLARVVPPVLLGELAARRIPHTPGRTLVEAAADDAPRLLQVIRALELPYSLAFNRGRVMVVPQAVSKATGLRDALTILRRSPHSAVAFGDAENDHELLDLCEVGIAVAWGSAALRAVADAVVPGTGPRDLAPYVERLAQSRRIPAARTSRRTLLLGHTDAGEPFTLAVRGRNVLVAGDARSGKSWLAGMLAEQLILHRYSVCVIDPEGDYRPLEALPGVTVLGGADPLPKPRDLLRALRHPDSSVVIDLSHVPHRTKIEYARAVLPALAAMRRGTGLPHRIVIDEAHYFLNGVPPHDLLDLEGSGYTLVTYRASHLPQALHEAAEVIVVTNESDPEEVAALHRICGSTDPIERWQTILGALGTGEAAALPVTDEAGGTLRRIRLEPRLTSHVRHREKYVDVPVAPGRAFVFTRHGHAQGRAATLREFVAALVDLPADVIEAHARRSDFSLWLADVFGDHPLAAVVRGLEEQVRNGRGGEATAAIASAIRGRYDVAMELEDVAAGTVCAGAAS